LNANKGILSVITETTGVFYHYLAHH